MNKTLIIYYSYEGHTEKLVKELVTKYHIESEKIIPINEKEHTGFTKYLWGGSQVIFKKRPKLRPIKSKLEDFDTIILATPIWAGQVSPAIYSFLNQNNISDKKINLFFTHQGGMKNVITKLNNDVKNLNLLNICDCLNVEKDFINQKDKLFEWFEKISNE